MAGGVYIRAPRVGDESSSISEHVSNSLEHIAASGITLAGGSFGVGMTYASLTSPEINETIIFIGVVGAGMTLCGLGAGFYFAKGAYNELKSAIRKYKANRS